MVAITITGILLTVVNSKRVELVAAEVADQLPPIIEASVEATAHRWARGKKLCSTCHRGDFPEADSAKSLQVRTERAVPPSGHPLPACDCTGPQSHAPHDSCAERHLPD